MDAGVIVDLFSGCGGFSLGAEMNGFRSALAVDVDPTLQSAYRKNFPQTKCIQASVADIDESDWRYLLGKGRPDGLIGGPPCQGFSPIGRRRKDDPRNSLIHQFYRHVAILRPKFFVMENVEGLLMGESSAILRDAIESISSRYKVLGPVVVNAADFGAATSRRRVVVVGYDTSEMGALDVDTFRPRPPRRLTTVRDAIADLPTPKADRREEDTFDWHPYPRKAQLSTYARRLRRRPPAGVGWRNAVDLHRKGLVSGVLETLHSKKVADRYARVKVGGTDHTTKSMRLDWNGQCPTLRAGTGADKGAFQAVRPLHPGKHRVITVREAARLQGFPDWFVFHPTKWHSFRMIGNSVSPIMAHGLLARIAAVMQRPPMR